MDEEEEDGKGGEEDGRTIEDDEVDFSAAFAIPPADFAPPPVRGMLDGLVLDL